jgi:hypothetical protein
MVLRALRHGPCFTTHTPTQFSPRVIWLTGILSGSRVFGTDMRCELFVTLLCVVFLHIFEGFPKERP